jgi:hypothetical protein
VAASTKEDSKMDYTMAMDNFTGLMATSIEESIRLAEEMALEYFI